MSSIIFCCHVPQNTPGRRSQKFQSNEIFFNNLTVLPALGNHETGEYGQLSPIAYDFNGSYSWNQDEMVDLWINNEWFPAKDRYDLKSHYAGFSYVTNRGLKVCGLNSSLLSKELMVIH